MACGVYLKKLQADLQGHLCFGGGVFFMSERNKELIRGLHRKDLTNIKFAGALLDMAIEEKEDDPEYALQQAKEVQRIAARQSRKENSIDFMNLYWKATFIMAQLSRQKFNIFIMN